jgi:hypothetical protein
MSHITVITYSEFGVIAYATPCKDKQDAVKAVQDSIRNGYFMSVIMKDGKYIDHWTLDEQREFDNAFGGYNEYCGAFAEI